MKTKTFVLSSIKNGLWENKHYSPNSFFLQNSVAFFLPRNFYLWQKHFFFNYRSEMVLVHQMSLNDSFLYDCSSILEQDLYIRNISRNEYWRKDLSYEEI